MKMYTQPHEEDDARADAAYGDQALYIFEWCPGEDAPLPFQKPKKCGRLYDNDVTRLGITAARYGVKKVSVGDIEGPYPHVDFVSGPLRRLMLDIAKGII